MPLGSSHRPGSTLAQVMTCCLTAPSHYLNQCWLIINGVGGYSPESTLMENDQDIIQHNVFESYTSKKYSDISKRPVYLCYSFISLIFTTTNKWNQRTVKKKNKTRLSKNFFKPSNIQTFKRQGQQRCTCCLHQLRMVEMLFEGSHDIPYTFLFCQNTSIVLWNSQTVHCSPTVIQCTQYLFSKELTKDTP